MFVEGRGGRLRGGPVEDRQGHARAQRLVSGLVAVGPPAELRGRPPPGRGRQPLAGAHAPRDRDVGALRRARSAGRRRRSATTSSPGSRCPVAGFADFGRPEFGRFKLVHTNPDFSTSGLSAVVSEYYAATGKKEGLTEADVTGSRARARVRELERSIVHYGDTTLFIADQLRESGPGYASAVAMEEVTLLDFNRNRGSQPKLVALYPPGGHLLLGQPVHRARRRVQLGRRRGRARASSRSTCRRRSTRRPPGATASVPRTSRRSRRGW